MYDKRVFELSSLEALRRQLKQLPLEGTGFSEFMEALNTFLTKERIVAELRHYKIILVWFK